MKKILLYACSGLLPFVLLGTVLMPESSGAPVSSTGAPQEVTCANAGCHDTYQLNSGLAISTITLEGNPDSYVPGQTYTVTVRISEPDIVRFGYQLVVLRNSDNKNAGELHVLDSVRTQIITNDIDVQDRRYATYTYPGTNALETGVGEWSIQWKAPATDIGPVTFYLAAISANNDGTDKGDHVFTTQRVLNASAVSGISAHTLLSDYTAHVFFNPMQEEVHCTVNLPNLTNIGLTLIDTRGCTIQRLATQGQSGGTHEYILDVRGYAAGMYFLRIESGSRAIIKPFVLQ